jgi:hypothetical protein
VGSEIIFSNKRKNFMFNIFNTLIFLFGAQYSFAFELHVDDTHQTTITHIKEDPVIAGKNENVFSFSAASAAFKLAKRPSFEDIANKRFFMVGLVTKPGNSPYAHLNGYWPSGYLPCQGMVGFCSEVFDFQLNLAMDVFGNQILEGIGSQKYIGAETGKVYENVTMNGIHFTENSLRISMPRLTLCETSFDCKIVPSNSMLLCAKVMRSLPGGSCVQESELDRPSYFVGLFPSSKLE